MIRAVKFALTSHDGKLTLVEKPITADSWERFLATKARLTQSSLMEYI